MKRLLRKKSDSALNKTSDRPLRAFQMSDVSLLAVSRTDLLLCRTKLTSQDPLGPFLTPFYSTYSIVFIENYAMLNL